MMWVETMRGNLVNLTRMDSVEVKRRGDNSQIIAFGQLTSDYDRHVAETLFTGNEEACERYMRRLKEAIIENRRFLAR